MKYLFVLIISIIFFQCSPKLSPDASWGNQRWIVTEMKGVPVQQSESRRDAYINFDVANKKFSGNGGCNQINGNYTIDNRTINFGEIISTKMSCIDIEFENVFLTTLSSVDHFEISGDDMLLKRKKETVLKLRSR
ncbi:MAG: META domain-containing protein [Chitinophagaceae bacterium]